MKHLLFFVLFLITVPIGLRAQTMVMTPDSATQGQNLSVTIVGMGTHFEETPGVSNFTAELERSGNNYAQVLSTNMPNDSTITGSLQIPTTMSGYYDLVVWVYDSTGHTFTQDSAFYVKAGSASITSISPSSAYDSQTVYVQITGANTNFENGTAPTIYFLQNGNIAFTALADSVYSNTSLGAQVSLPSPPTGYYDVIVQNNVYSDTGRQLFKVLGPMPTVALVPDSGAVGSTFDVSIVGQGTDFAVNGGVSVPLNLNLKQGGVTYFHTRADSVISNTLAYATITLSDSITPGTYDAEIYGTGDNNMPFDLYTTFLVTAHHTTIRNHQGYSIAAKPADTVTIGVTGAGVNFIYQGNQVVKTVMLVNGAYSITATTVKVANDTSLSAFFAIPPNAAIGSYDIQIVEPGTGTMVTGKSEFVVLGSYQDSNYVTLPNIATQGQSITTTTVLTSQQQSYCYLYRIYLQKDTFFIAGSILHNAYPDTIIANFPIPATADTGLYNIVMELTCDSECCYFDSIPNMVRIESSAGVDDIIYSGLINSLHVTPNPAQDIASISFAMSAPSHVRLIIYDALGRTIATLCDQTVGTGFQNFEWSSSDMPSGSYFYELTAGENIYGGRIVIQH